jgi:hypothetical protein
VASRNRLLEILGLIFGGAHIFYSNYETVSEKVAAESLRILQRHD